jgi:hypothetical protein
VCDTHALAHIVSQSRHSHSHTHIVTHEDSTICGPQKHLLSVLVSVLAKDEREEEGDDVEGNL